MKILHCCLAAFYIDDFSYQENILPKFHKSQGHDVEILASTETYMKNLKLGYIPASSYTTSEGISIERVSYISWLPKLLVRKFRIYNNIERCLNRFKPDVIFMHDCQFLSILTFVKFAKKNNVKIYIDSHTDFINSGTNWISKNILHKIIYKFCAKLIEKYTVKFYGTLPARSVFLEDVYGIAKEKIEFLPFGVDDSLFDADKKVEIRSTLRAELNLNDDDFVIVTGGKIDARKNIHKLIEVFLALKEDNEISNAKLIVFGKPVEELKRVIEKAKISSDIIYLDWLPSKEVYKYFIASDLGFFPGTHSVLWEEAVGTGLPCVFLKWEGIQHVDLGGNCIFLNSSANSDIKSVLVEVLKNKAKFELLKTNANELGPKFFAYSEIAKRSIGL